MNKHYLIWPVVMVAGFIAYFIQFDKQDTLAQQQKEAREAAEKAAKDAEKERLKELAAQENLKQAEIKAKEEAQKLAEKEAKQFAKDEEVRQDTAGRRADIDRMAKEKGDLQAKLAETRRARLKAESESFDAARAVELAKIERRAVEMEIQRAAGLIANKVDASSLVEIPVFAAETKK
ncbi:MAG: hypothetical protein IAE82_02535 [Opitutaceae bacterium]|nr:hypothetical protein [Opitutaceae bacterium]